MKKYIVALSGNYEVRTETRLGRQFLVVPAVMMVEGVHHGSAGPILHLVEELSKFTASWDGIPVVIQHPQDEDGAFISANSPELIEQAVGRIYNTRMEDESLRSEVWLDEEQLRQVSPDTLEQIQRRRLLEVSVGVFTEEELASGEFDGEHYDSIARNLRPDHLALLPGGVGACSIDDGCGIRANEKGGTSLETKKLFQTMKLDKEAYSAILLVINELGLQEMVTNIRRKLDAMDTDTKMYFLTEVYEESFVYEVRQRDGGSTLYRRGYSANEDGSIEFAEEPIEVRRKVEFVTLQQGRGNSKKRNVNINLNSKEDLNMSDDKKPCCEDVVDALIANERTKYTTEDKVWLLTLEENQVTKLIPESVEKPKEQKKAVVETPQINAEQALEVLKGSFKEVKDFLEILPDEMKDQFQSGLALHQEQREYMVKEILEDTGTVWTEGELKAMKMDTLLKVHKSIGKVVDYSALGGGAKLVPTTHQEPPMLPGYLKEKKETIKSE